MSTDAQALAIVEEALEVEDPQARAALIDRRCDGNAILRARVEQLLAQDDKDFRLLPTESFVRPLSVVEAIPDRIGPYRVTAEIARGGMGAVVKAERDDGVFTQTVAIKLIRGDLASPRAQARFAEERRILARLSHPDIVRILDGGEAGGRAWLAMDFIDGIPIDEALNARAADRAQRLDAIEAVGDAVAYAHRNLVIHADIKPSNVLMTADGRIHLLDFGIARLIVGLDPNESGDPYPLTKGYAAPERAVGVAPTIASDVFSLGVLMLELLNCETPKPDSLFVPGTRLPVRQLTGDLAAIVARALAEVPEQRYPDVAAFVADIRRHRRAEPVHARLDAGWRYVAGRFVWRHRRGLALTAAVALALIATTVVSVAQYIRAERARAEADHRFMEVRQVAQFMLTDLSDAMADAPGTVAARARLASTASLYLGKLAAVAHAPVDLRLDTARGYRRLALLQGMFGVASLGKPTATKHSLDAAERLLTDVLRRQPDNADALEEMGWVSEGRWSMAADAKLSAQFNALAADYFRRALTKDGGRQTALIGSITTDKSRAFDLIWGANRPRDAVPVLRQALARLRSIAFVANQRRDARLLEVALLNRLGDALYYSKDVVGALGPYREAHGIIRRQLAHHNSVVWLAKLGEAKFNVSGTLSDLPGQNEAALSEARAGISALKPVLDFGPDANIENILLILYAQEGNVLSSLGRSAEAVEASTESIALRRGRLAREPGDLHRIRDLAVALPNHAEVLARAGMARQSCMAARDGVAEWNALRSAKTLTPRDAADDVPKAIAAVSRFCAR